MEKVLVFYQSNIDVLNNKNLEAIFVSKNKKALIKL
jgi:hypothetical protein